MPSLVLAPGSVFADDYTVVAALAQRPSSAIYVVDEGGTRRTLTLLDPALVQDPAVRARFEKAVRIGAQLESDHVGRVAGAGIDDATDTPWIATEVADAGDLAGLVKQRGALPEGEVRRILEAVCDAVGAGHRLGIVHGGLEAESVLLGAVVKVVGFGIAKLALDAKLEPASPPTWLAPEQIESSTLLPQSDVWAIGLLGFFALTGRPYWHAANAVRVSSAQLMLEITEEPLESASARARALGVTAALPPAFDVWFSRCVSRETKNRFADADTARSTIAAAFAGAAIQTSPPRDPPREQLPTVPVLDAAALARVQTERTLPMADSPTRKVRAETPPVENAAFPPAPVVAPPPPADAAPAPEMKRRPPLAAAKTMTLGNEQAPGFDVRAIRDAAVARAEETERERARAREAAAAVPAPPPPPAPAPAPVDQSPPAPAPTPVLARAPAAFDQQPPLPPPPNIPMPEAHANVVARPAAEEGGGAGRWIIALLAVIVL
jgi:hypothetical protein